MRVADRVVVATDAIEVLDVCRSAGAEAVITRSDHPSGTDRVAEVAAMSRYMTFDVIVNVQGDEPYVPEEAVGAAVKVVASGRFALGTVAAPADASVQRDPSVVKVVSDDTGRAMYFSRAPIPFLRDDRDTASLAPLVRRHIGVYAYQRAALARWVALPPHPLELVERLEQLRPLAAGIPMGVATIGAVSGGGIDTEEDLALANALWTEHHRDDANV
jgi:3-deoxy-manno-octulosonate cytidylyltransferase (CMP-KDO synthetase)